MALNLSPNTLGVERAYIAGGAITQYAVVVRTTDTADGLDPRVIEPAATSDAPEGVAQNSAAAGEVVRVRISGESFVIANGPYSVGDQLSIAATSGTVDTAASGDRIVGVAREAAAAAGDIKVVQLDLTSTLP
jgi:hypothetical protein